MEAKTGSPQYNVQETPLKEVTKWLNSDNGRWVLFIMIVNAAKLKNKN